MKSGSLFSRILLTLVTTMLIPFATILSLYFFTEKMTSELVFRSSDRVLSQFFTVVDNTMLEVSNTILEIGNNRQCLDYSQYAVYQPEKTHHQIIDVRDALYEKYSVNYHDVFVYYPKDDRIISAINGSVTSDFYLMSHYEKDGDYNRDDFKAILQMDMSHPHMFKLEGRKDYLCVGMRQTFISNRERDFVIVVVMRPEFISALTLESQSEDEGTLLIYDQNKTLLVSNNGKQNYSIDWYDGTNSYHDFQAEGGDYLIQVQNASSLDGYYAYATSTHLFSDSLEDIRMAMLLGALICLVVGAVAVCRGTSRVYSPIKNIIEKIDTDEAYDRTAFNEIDLIEKVLESSKEDKRLISRLSRKSAGTQKKKFIQSLILGTYPMEDLANGLETHKIEMLSKCFAVGIIYVDNRGTIEVDQQDFVIQNVFEEVAERQGKGYIVELDNNQYVLLLNLRTADTMQTESSDWKEACKFLEDHFEACVSAYFGNIHIGVDAIPVAFREAVATKKYRYLLKDARYLAYADIKDRKFNYVSSMESKLSRAVIGYLKEKNHGISEEDFVSQIMEMSGISEESSIDTVECFRYEMLSVLNKAVTIYNGAEQGKQIIEELMQAENLEGFQMKLVELMKAPWGYKLDFSKAQALCERVAAYIRAQYWNPELSLQVIGDEVQMSPYYVSKLFKEEYDISVPAYITKIRIEQAKKELSETDKSIRVIAEETGFLSSTVFIRTFKKVEGITPGGYRAIKE